MEIDDICVVRKGNHKVRHCRTDIADHDTADDQHGHLIQYPGHENHKAHTDHGAHKGRTNHHPGAYTQGISQGRHHHQGHHQLGTGGDTQGKGACDGVVEEGLQQIP